MSFTKINHYEKEYADAHHDTALNVAEGVEDQPIISPYFTRRKKRALTTTGPFRINITHHLTVV